MDNSNVLEESVLVLDKNFAALEITTVKDAFDILFRDSGVVIDKYQKYSLEDWIEYSDMVISTSGDVPVGSVIRSPRHTILVPDVILITDYNGYNKSNNVLKYSRHNIFQRDNYECQYCGKHFSKRDLTLDHILPKSRGGRAAWNNIVSACKPCNSRKGNLLLSETTMKLIKQPTTPTWKETFRLPKGKESWTLYL